MNYVRDTVSNTAKITYQSTPVVTVLDIGGTGQAFDLQYGYDYGWKIRLVLGYHFIRWA